MKYISFIGYGLLTISVIIIIAFLATGNFTVGALDFPLADVLLYWTYFVLGLAAISAIVLPLINIVQNPKAMLRSLMGMGIVVVVFIVCYLMADDTPLVTPIGTIDNKTALVVSDTGLFATYLAFAGAILAIVVGELAKVFKR